KPATEISIALGMCRQRSCLSAPRGRDSIAQGALALGYVAENRLSPEGARFPRFYDDSRITESRPVGAFGSLTRSPLRQQIANRGGQFGILERVLQDVGFHARFRARHDARPAGVARQHDERNVRQPKVAAE